MNLQQVFLNDVKKLILEKEKYQKEDPLVVLKFPLIMATLCQKH